MAKDRAESEKREKKEKKHKEKHSENNGVTKERSLDKDEKRKRKEEKKRQKEAGEAGVSATESMPQREKAQSEAVDEDGDATMDVNGKDDGKLQIKRELILNASVPFANPMADDKTMRRVLRGIKKAAKHKTLRRGVKEVVKSLRKSPANHSGSAQAVVVLAADISPFDVISHIPVLCEDHHVPYIYVPSRAELGAAGSTKRPTSVVMVVPTVPPKRKAELEKEGKEDKEDWSEAYSDLVKVVEKAGKDVRI